MCSSQLTKHACGHTPIKTKAHGPVDGWYCDEAKEANKPCPRAKWVKLDTVLHPTYFCDYCIVAAVTILISNGSNAVELDTALKGFGVKPEQFKQKWPEAFKERSASKRQDSLFFLLGRRVDEVLYFCEYFLVLFCPTQVDQAVLMTISCCRVSIKPSGRNLVAGWLILGNGGVLECYWLSVLGRLGETI